MSKQPGLRDFFLQGDNNLNKTMNKIKYCIVLYNCISVKSMRSQQCNLLSYETLICVTV